MFTGIVTDIGIIDQVKTLADTRVTIRTAYDPMTIALGASIACSGVCLTVIDKGGDVDGSWFAVDVSAETIARTALGQWTRGRRLNLERALKLGEELGGHIVTGHVDGIGLVRSIRETGGSHRVDLQVGRELGAFVAPKGSVAIDGVSLTVNSVDDEHGSTMFDINIIPHTWTMTTLGGLSEEGAVNIEIDVLARYLGRMREAIAAST